MRILQAKGLLKMSSINKIVMYLDVFKDVFYNVVTKTL